MAEWLENSRLIKNCRIAQAGLSVWGYGTVYMNGENNNENFRGKQISITFEPGCRKNIISGFLAGLSETKELPVDFNEKLFHRLVDFATVYPDDRVVFAFRNGAEGGTEI